MDFLYPELSYKIRGIFFAVYKTLGSLHKESVYQKALVSEFAKNNISFDREVELPVVYDGEEVGKYRADFVIDGKIIVEVKVSKFNSREFENQLFHYLATSGYRLAFLVNFGALNKVYIKRWVMPERKS